VDKQKFSAKREVTYKGNMKNLILFIILIFIGLNCCKNNVENSKRIQIKDIINYISIIENDYVSKMLEDNIYTLKKIIINMDVFTESIPVKNYSEIIFIKTGNKLLYNNYGDFILNSFSKMIEYTNDNEKASIEVNLDAGNCDGYAKIQFKDNRITLIIEYYAIGGYNENIELVFEGRKNEEVIIIDNTIFDKSIISTAFVKLDSNFYINADINSDIIGSIPGYTGDTEDALYNYNIHFSVIKKEKQLLSNFYKPKKWYNIKYKEKVGWINTDQVFIVNDQ